MKKQLTAILVLGSSLTLAGCIGGGVAGAAGQAVAGSVLTGVIAGGTNRARFQRLDCAGLESEIAGAYAAMINPTTIPFNQAYIRDARSVAEEKGCMLDAEA